MFGWFDRADKGVDLFARWFTVLTVLSGLYSWLTKQVTWFGQSNWPEAILIGIAMALVTLFVVAASLALIRFFRPLGIKDEATATATSATYDDTKLRSDIAGLSNTVRAVINDYQRMSGLEARFSEQMEKVQARLGKLDEIIIAVSSTYAGEVASLRAALGAVFHRERLHHLAQTLEAGARELATPTNDRSVSFNRNEWEVWEANERAWRSVLEQWCELASCYVPGISGKVLGTDSAHYRRAGQAKIDQFPDPEAYIAYKEFCALWKNFRDWQEEAAKAVHQAAFNSGSLGERPVLLGEKWLGKTDG